MLESIGIADAVNLLTGFFGVEISSDFSTISGLDYLAMNIGGSDISGFIGMGTPDFDKPFVDQDLVGFGLNDLDFAISVFGSSLPTGYEMFSVLYYTGRIPPPLANSYTAAAMEYMRQTLPYFFAMDISVGSVGTYGFGDVFTIQLQDIRVQANIGTPLFGTAAGLSLANLPSINFIETFGTEDTNGNRILDEGEDTDNDGYLDIGYEVATGGDPIFLEFTEVIIGLEIGYAAISIADFVQLYGSFAFYLGPTYDLDLKLGNASVPFGNWEFASYTFGGSDIMGFVGLGGYEDVNGDGRITDDDALEEGSLGFYLDDLDFGLALFQSTSPLSLIMYSVLGVPIEPLFFAMDLSARSVGFTGLDDFITMEAHQLELKLNISNITTPGLEAFLDFSTSPELQPERHDEDRDYDGKMGEPLGFEVRTGGDSIYLDFDNYWIEATIGYAEVSLGGAVQLAGSFTFAKGPKHTVKLTNGDEIEVATVTLGAANVNAFMGLNGPYHTDTNGDLLINDDDPINEDAVGLVMNNLDIGIVLATPTNLLDLRAFLAAKASMDRIGLVGVPGITAEATDMEVAINLSAGAVFDLEVVDWTESFQDQDWDDDDVIDGDGFAVPAGVDNIIIDYDDFLIKAFGSVRVGIETDGESWFGLNGDLDFEMSKTHLQAFVNGRLFVGPEDSPFFELSTTGLFIIDSKGIGLKLDASLEVGLGEELGIELNAEFKVTFNTTSEDIVYEIPETFAEVPDESVDGEGNRVLVIPGVPPMKGGPATPYLIVEASGYLQILDSFKLTGDFGLYVLGTGDIEMTIDAHISILDTQLNVAGGAGIYFGETKGFAAAIEISFDSGSALSGVGFDLSGTFTLKVNTTSIDRTYSGVKVEAYSAEIGIDATLVLMDFLTLDGTVVIKVSGSGFSFDVDATMALTGLGSFTAVGSLDVSSAGMVASLELSGSLDFAVVEFNGRFHFAINTTNSSKSVKVLDVNPGSGEVAGFKSQTIAAQTLMISFGGELCVGPFCINGGAELVLSSDSIAVNISATLDLLGFGKLAVNGAAEIGWGSSPYFALNIGLGANVISIAGIQLSATFTLQLNTDSSTRAGVSANSFKVAVSGTISVWLFDISVSASITYANDVLRLSFTGSLNALGFSFQVGRFDANAHETNGMAYIQSDGKFNIGLRANHSVSVSLVFVKVTFAMSFEINLSHEAFTASVQGSVSGYVGISIDLGFLGKIEKWWSIGSLSAGASIAINYASGSLTVSAYVDIDVGLFDDRVNMPSFTIGGSPEPTLATQSGSTLNLNPSTSNGADTITLDTSSSGKVTVSSGGYYKDFYGISKITGSLGAGNDAVFIKGNGNMTVDIDGGSGDDSIVTDETYQGVFDIDGGSGDDTIISAKGNDVIIGGAGNDTIQSGSGNDTINGGTGNDAIHAGAGDDTIDGGSGNDGLIGGSGNDQLTGGSGDDTLIGEDGDDVYIFADSWGEDLLQETAVNSNTVNFTGVTNPLSFTLGENNRYLVSAGASSLFNRDKNIATFIGGSSSDTFDVSHVLPTSMTLQGGGDDDQYNISYGDRVQGDVTITDTSGDNKMRVWTAYDSALALSATDVAHASRNIDFENGNIQEIDIYALESDVSVTEAIDITDGFITQAKSIVWSDTIKANYINFHSEETINVDHDLEALNILESGADALTRAQDDLTAAIAVRDAAQTALDTAEAGLDQTALAAAQSDYDDALDAYNDALDVVTLAQAAETAANEETAAEDALAEVSQINMDFDGLIDDIQSTGDTLKELLVDIFVVNGNSDHLIYGSGSFKTYNDVPYVDADGNSQEVDVETVDLYDSVQKILLDAEKARDEYAYSPTVKNELTKLVNTVSGLTDKVDANQNVTAADVLDVANEALVTAGALLAVEQDDADFVAENIDGHRNILGDLKSDIDSLESTLDGLVDGLNKIMQSHYDDLQAIKDLANSEAILAGILNYDSGAKADLEAIATGVNGIDKDDVITNSMVSDLGDYSTDVQTLSNAANTFKSSINSNLSTVTSALNDAETEAAGIVTTLGDQAGTTITSGDYATYQASVFTPLATITSKANSIDGAAINPVVEDAWEDIKGRGDAFATAKTNNEDIEVDDILAFANEVLILAGEIKAVEDDAFAVEQADAITAEANAEAAATAALAAAGGLTLDAAQTAANSLAGDLDTAATALAAITDDSSEAIAAATATLADAQAIVDAAQAIVDSGVAAPADNAIRLHSEIGDIVFNSQIDGSNNGEIAIEAPEGEILSAGGRVYEATGFAPQIVAEEGTLVMTAHGRIGDGDSTSIWLNGLSILTDVANVTLTSTNLNDVYMIEKNDIVVADDSSMGVLILLSHTGTAEVNSPVDAGDEPVRITGDQLEILKTIQTTDNITVVTTDLTLPIVIVPDLSSIGSVPEAATGMLLEQDEMDRLLTPATVFIGSEQITNILVLGDGGDTAFQFNAPSVILRGDKITINNDISGYNLVFFGDGTTTTLSADITQSDNVSIFDSVEVNGNRTINSDQQITFGAPGVTVQGNGGGNDDLSLNAGTSIVANIAFGGTNDLRNLNLNAGSTINLNQSIDITGDLTITDATNVTFGGNVTIGGDLVISGVEQVTLNGDLTVEGTITITTEEGNISLNGDIVTSGAVTLTAPDDEDISFGGSVSIDNGDADLTIYQVDNLSFDDDVTVRNLTQVDGSGTTSFAREVNAAAVDLTTRSQIRFRDELITSGNVTLFAEQIDLDDAVEVDGNFTVSITDSLPVTDYSVDFDDSLNVGGNLVLNTVDSVTVSGAAEIGGTVNILTVGDDITFDSSLETGGDVTLETVNLADISIDGNLTVNSGNSDLTITLTRNSTFSGSVNVRDFTITDATGTAAFSQQVNAANISITSEVATSMANTVTVTGNMTLFSDEIDFGSNTGSINGSATSVLILAPYGPAATTTIDIGSPVSNSGTLDVSDQDLRAIATNWKRVVIGHLNTGMGTVRIGTLLVTQTTSVHNTLEVHGGQVILEEEIELATTGVDYLLLKANDPEGDGVTVNAVIAEESTVRNEWIRIESQADVTINRPVYATDRISIATGFDTDGEASNDSGDIIIDHSDDNTGLLETTDDQVDGIIELVTGTASGDILFIDTTIIAAGDDSTIRMYLPVGSVDGTSDLSTLTADNLALDAGANIDLNTVVDDIIMTSVPARSDISATDYTNIFFAAEDKSLDGLRSVTSGNITLTNEGSLTVEDGSEGIHAEDGTIHITLTGDGSDLTLDDPVTASSDISFIAPRDIDQNDDITSSTGDIDLTATTGSITMTDGVTTTAVDGADAGNITYTAANDIALSILHSDGTVTLTWVNYMLFAEKNTI